MAKRRPHRTGSIFQRGGIWWIQFHINGARQRESSYSAEKTEAERLLKRRLADAAVGKIKEFVPSSTTVSQLIQLVVEDYQLTRKRSLDDLRARAEKNIIPRIGSLPVANFRDRAVRAYIVERRESGASDATIQRELAIIRRGFHLGLRNDPPLVERIPIFPKLDLDNARQGFIEHAQYLKLRNALPDHLKAIFVVGYHLGMRLGELRKLRWEQVEFESAQIRLSASQTKGKRARTLPIFGEMKEWLLFQLDKRNEKWPDLPWVFNWNLKPIGAHLKGWSKACEAADQPGLHFHDLRRSAVRNLERAGVPRRVAMEITGHRTEAIYRRYDIVNPADLSRAGEKLSAYMKEQVAAAKRTTNRERRERTQ
jgi:integrase